MDQHHRGGSALHRRWGRLCAVCRGIAGTVRRWRFGGEHTLRHIRLHHEFPRDWRSTGHPIAADWAEHIDKPRQRTTRIANRFFGLAETAHSVVFVRTFGPRDTDAIAVEDMLQALGHRFPTQRTAVLLVNYRGRMPAAHPVHRMVVAGRAGAGWRGDPGSWDAALSALGLRLTPGLHRPAAPNDLSAQHAANSIPE